MPEVIGERIPGIVNDYIDQLLPNYAAVARLQRNQCCTQFQARYQTERIIVYGTPKFDFGDAIGSLEMTIGELMDDPRYSPLLPAKRQ